MKTSCVVPVGMPWANTLNSPNWPTGMVPPDQSISLVTEVKVPSSVVTGLGSAVLTAVTCQPDPASGFSRMIGCSSGNWIFRPVTAALCDSFGTRKVRMASEVPRGRLDGLTVTWAAATAASSATRQSAHTAASPSFLII